MNLGEVLANNGPSEDIDIWLDGHKQVTNANENKGKRRRKQKLEELL